MREHIALIDELVAIMLDVILTKEPTVKIGGEKKSRSLVMSQYLKLNDLAIEHVIDRFKEQRHAITHVSTYLRTMLYTAKQEMDHFYTNRVRADGVVY